MGQSSLSNRKHCNCSKIEFLLAGSNFKGNIVSVAMRIFIY